MLFFTHHLSIRLNEGCINVHNTCNITHLCTCMHIHIHVRHVYYSTVEKRDSVTGCHSLFVAYVYNSVTEKNAHYTLGMHTDRWSHLHVYIIYTCTCIYNIYIVYACVYTYNIYIIYMHTVCACVCGRLTILSYLLSIIMYN